MLSLCLLVQLLLQTRDSLPTVCMHWHGPNNYEAVQWDHHPQQNPATTHSSSAAALSIACSSGPPYVFLPSAATCCGSKSGRDLTSRRSSWGQRAAGPAAAAVPCSFSPRLLRCGPNTPCAAEQQRAAGTWGSRA